MKSAEYWAKRLEALSESQLAKGEQYIETMNREYAKTMAKVQKDLEVWYNRLAKNNGVSLPEARKMLKVNELREFHWSVDEYIKAGRENAVDQRWMKQLENASSRVHITKLEAIQTQMQQHIEMLAASKQAGTAQLLGGIYKDGYYKGIFELQQGTGIGHSFAKLDKRQIDSVLIKPWAPDGANFSSRIWQDKDKLLSELQSLLTQGIVRGDASTERTIADFAKRMGVSNENARRLIMTESAFFSGASRRAGYAELDVEQFQNIATLDRVTSEKCRTMDKTVFLLSEAEPGLTCAPFHARCRTVDIPHFDDNIKERAARSDKDGKTYDVPGDMTYPEWAEQYAPPDATKAPLVKPVEPVEPVPPLQPSVSPELPKDDTIKGATNEFRAFKDVDEVKAWESEVEDDWMSRLTAQEASAITQYTGSGYREINRNLREGARDARLDELADSISSGIRKFDLKENIVAYRGSNLDALNQLPVETLKGLAFKDKAFWSTSLLKEQQFPGSYRMEVRVAAGTVGAFINPLSLFKDTEYEFLLDAGLLYRIVEATEEDGVRYLVVEVDGYAD